MKATVNKEKWTITLDNEAVKAIRFCYGLNTDLRVSIKVPRGPLFSWIEQNKCGLFGLVMLDMAPQPEDDDWPRYERMIYDVVQQVLR